MVHSVVGVWRIVGAGDQRFQRWESSDHQGTSVLDSGDIGEQFYIVTRYRKESLPFGFPLRILPNLMVRFSSSSLQGQKFCVLFGFVSRKLRF